MMQLTDHQRYKLALANNFFDTASPVIAGRLTFDNLINESYAISSMEASIPESSLFDFHFDMIFKPGGLTNYYKSMSQGHNEILEAAKKIFPNSPQITESIESFRSYMRSLITESAIALGEPVLTSGAGVDSALSGGEYSADASGGFWGTLKSLWDTLTEGGSAIGIIHLILDVIGAVGDFIFPGVGVAADIINGIIYLVRGKWLLAAISFIAAVVIGGGDLLKLSKGTAKAAEPVFVALAKGGTSSADDAAKLIAKMPTSGPVMKFLKQIAGFIGGALAKAVTILGSFIQGMANVAGYIPGLKQLLKPILDGLATTLTKFGTRMGDFCTALKTVDQTVTKEALEKLERGMTAGNTYKMSKDGKTLYAFDDAGKKVGAMSSEKLAKSGFVEIKYGKNAGSTSKLFTTPAEFVKYQKGVSRLGKNAKFGKRFAAFFKNIPNATKNFSAALPFFLGKQIYKIVTGEDWSKKGWSKAEVEGHGNAALNTWINDRIAKEKAETGAVYLPAITLDSSDKEVFNKITEYQNDYAQKLGQPAIIPVIYDKFKNEPVMEEFDAFWKEVEKGNVAPGSEGDNIEHSIADDLKKEEEKYVDSEKETSGVEAKPAEEVYYSQKAVAAPVASAPEEKKSLISRVKSFMDFKG
jgi:hypothetical protein